MASFLISGAGALERAWGTFGAQVHSSTQKKTPKVASKCYREHKKAQKRNPHWRTPARLGHWPSGLREALTLKIQCLS